MKTGTKVLIGGGAVATAGVLIWAARRAGAKATEPVGPMVQDIDLGPPQEPISRWVATTPLRPRASGVPLTFEEAKKRNEVTPGGYSMRWRPPNEFFAGPQGSVSIQKNGQDLPLTGTPETVKAIRELASVWSARQLRDNLPTARRGPYQPLAGDEYTSEMYWWPVCMPSVQFSSGVTVPARPCEWVQVDQYGRYFPGHYGSSRSFWDGMLQLIDYAAPYTVFIPVYGPAIYGALAYAKALGNKESLIDATIQVARSQVAPEYQLVFDIGVGVVKGKSVPDSAVDEMRSRMDPQQRAAFDEGRQLASRMP